MDALRVGLNDNILEDVTFETMIGSIMKIRANKIKLLANFDVAKRHELKNAHGEFRHAYLEIGRLRFLCIFPLNIN